ncbi:hypothetical protein F4604DRAFT_1730889, partial [Suillus subluteus]
MNLGTLNDTMIGNASASSQMCASGIFDIGIGSPPPWIVGDTFLKNVYSVFHASPAAVGFAQLASGLSSSTGSSDPNPVQVTGLTPLPTGTSASSSEWKLDQRQHKLCFCFSCQEHRFIAYSSCFCCRLLHPLPL